MTWCGGHKSSAMQQRFHKMSAGSINRSHGVLYTPPPLSTQATPTLQTCWNK
ncbi:hypothetical protein AN958_03261 [Leucoagaricus sp. SymC.cos]|nr:hypothetical protein AN958_03261 [Leucoagaricus sp. SymC.cos]